MTSSLCGCAYSLALVILNEVKNQLHCLSVRKGSECTFANERLTCSHGIYSDGTIARHDMKFSSSRKVWLAALALGCIAGATLVVGLLLNGQTASQPPNTNISPAQAQVTISATVASLLDIPLYPGAQDVEGDPLNDSVDLYAHTSFTVTASRDDVLAFYEKQLLAKGWLADDRQLGYVSPEDIRNFRWFDSSGVSPYALIMAVYIRTDVLSDDHEPRFYIYKHKWPDIYFRSLYPDATGVKTTDAILTPDYYSYFRSITTTYTTNANLSTLANYYTPIMIGLGCQASPSDQVAGHPQLPSFGYHCSVLSGPQRHWGFWVTIKVRSQEGKLNTVEMVSNGVDAGDRNKP